MDEAFTADLFCGESQQNEERLYLLLWLIKREIGSEEQDFCFVCLFVKAD